MDINKKPTLGAFLKCQVCRYTHFCFHPCCQLSLVATLHLLEPCSFWVRHEVMCKTGKALRGVQNLRVLEQAITRIKPTGHWKITSLYNFPYSTVLPESNKLLMIYRKYLLLSKYHKYINIKYDLQLLKVHGHCDLLQRESSLLRGTFIQQMDWLQDFHQNESCRFSKKKRASPVEMGCVLFHVFSHMRDKIHQFIHFVQPHDYIYIYILAKGFNKIIS